MSDLSTLRKPLEGRADDINKQNEWSEKDRSVVLSLLQ